MFAFKFICIVSSFAILVESASEKVRNKNNFHRQKRDGGLSAALIGAAISTGASLAGTTVGALKQNQYSVAVSGSVTNFASNALILDFCRIEKGEMNEPLRDVASGQQEGFGGHKAGVTATGHWVQCRYRAGNDALIYLMYSAPYSFDFHKNLLAASICHRTSKRCQQTTINDMYYGTRADMKQKSYYDNIETLKVCNMGYCITGVMGTSHRPQIAWKVYPTKFENLATAVQGSAAANQWDKKDYERYVANNLA